MASQHHDTGYKELFSYPEFVQQLIEGFAPAEIAQLMDFATLKRHLQRIALKARLDLAQLNSLVEDLNSSNKRSSMLASKNAYDGQVDIDEATHGLAIVDGIYQYLVAKCKGQLDKL